MTGRLHYARVVAARSALDDAEAALAAWVADEARAQCPAPWEGDAAAGYVASICIAGAYTLGVAYYGHDGTWRAWCCRADDSTDLHRASKTPRPTPLAALGDLADGLRAEEGRHRRGGPFRRMAALVCRDVRMWQERAEDARLREHVGGGR